MFVLKFGGSALQDIERIKACSEHIAQRYARDPLAIVVSAMQGTTDELFKLSHAIDSEGTDLEHDVVCSVGEQITAGLLVLALKKIGVCAKSYLAWQLPIYTDTKTSSASIRFIETKELMRDIENSIVPVIAGFQGITPTGRITTLGRGGSDLTAVALTYALKAKRCDMYKDVLGVYTNNPHSCATAEQLLSLSYEQMLRMIQTEGAKVVQESAVLFAQKYSVPLYIRSYLEDKKGTFIGEKKDDFTPM